jgi:hypothetical protein
MIVCSGTIEFDTDQCLSVPSQIPPSRFRDIANAIEGATAVAENVIEFVPQPAQTNVAALTVRSAPTPAVRKDATEVSASTSW